MRLAPVLLVVVAGALLAVDARADAAAKHVQRFALLIAAHDGGDGLPRLRYAGRDATRLADVLVDVGGFARADILSVIDGDSGVVLDLFDELEARVREAKSRGDDVVVVAYYSGHAQDGRLRLGKTTLEMRELRRRLETSSADVRLGFVDSCGAGEMTREKGAMLAAPFVVRVDEDLSTKGQVIIASSSSDEVSQESDDIQGSFFTHYLASGLRGDADRDTDGRVTLDEAYAYAYGRTVAATSATRAGAQHPTYAFELKGAGDVVLTNPGDAFITVEFPEVLEGRYFVVDLTRQLFVAEVEKQRGGASKIALPKGQYAVKKRLDSHLLMTRVEGQQKGVVVINDATMERVDFNNDYAKGTPISISTDLDREIGFSLSVGGGVQQIMGVVDDGGLFPTMPLFVLNARVHHLLRSQLTLDADIGFGSVQATRTVDGGALGSIDFDVQASEVQGGLAILWEQPLKDLTGYDVVVGAGPRMAGLFFVHEFNGETRPAGLERQTFLTFTPGVAAFVGWSPVEFAHLEVSARAHYLAYNVDELRHMAVVEGFASVWLDL
ncbi:MAG: caspase family protein [Deltaproteobacteria bacterium]|nr:caspase family protein [Deltaproteobacteria bacterium]